MKARFELFDEDVDEDGASVEAKVVLDRVEDGGPVCGFGGCLYLRQVENDRASLAAQRLCVVGEVQRSVGHAGGVTVAVLMGDMAIVEMEATGSEDARGHLQLLLPVGDDFPAVEVDSPVVHLPGNDLGDVMELWVARKGQLDTPEVVQRHGINLAQGVLAIEHPAVGPRQQRVGNIAQPR